ncbi:competence protein CoiA [Peribacillus sp. SCS-37]|uniref:competence protein CoiA n=1 Tax=Paraperibacillus esterisolvens TaxID=3115296 RepID=UPI003906A982
MLTVKNVDGTLFTITRRSEKIDIEFLKKKEWYCPCCSQRVILKSGTKRISHFAHKKADACSISLEPESDYHLQGKLQLFEWLRNQGMRPELERYLKENNQRPDLYFEWEGNQFAIEYQCSPLPYRLFRQRSLSYQQSGIVPVWIIGRKKLISYGSTLNKLTSFQWYFAQASEPYPSIISLCPFQKAFFRLGAITAYSPQISFAETEKLPLQKTPFIHLFQNNSSVTTRQVVNWFKKLDSWKISAYKHASIHHPLYSAIYLNGLLPSSLPPFIGLPVPFGHHIETPAVEWQAYVYLDVLLKFEEGGPFKKSLIHEAFQRRITRRDVKLRELSSHGGHTGFQKPLDAFLDVLRRSGYVADGFKKGSLIINRCPDFSAETGAWNTGLKFFQAFGDMEMV